MNNYWNSYTYQTFKILSNLNIMDDDELIINEKDLNLIKLYYKELESVFRDFDEFIIIVKNLSIQYMIEPVEMAYILFDELKNDEK